MKKIIIFLSCLFNIGFLYILIDGIKFRMPFTYYLSKNIFISKRYAAHFNSPNYTDIRAYTDDTLDGIIIFFILYIIAFCFLLAIEPVKSKLHLGAFTKKAIIFLSCLFNTGLIALFIYITRIQKINIFSLNKKIIFSHRYLNCPVQNKINYDDCLRIYFYSINVVTALIFLFILYIIAFCFLLMLESFEKEITLK